MNWVFISIILTTIGQTAFCGFSLALLVSYIGRMLFLMRLIGSVIPIKVSMGFEAARLFFAFLGVVFSKSGVDWINLALTILFSAIICALYLVDDTFYLYVVGEDEEGD